jgi:hypothetical protein
MTSEEADLLAERIAAAVQEYVNAVATNIARGEATEIAKNMVRSNATGMATLFQPGPNPTPLLLNLRGAIREALDGSVDAITGEQG